MSNTLSGMVEDTRRRIGEAFAELRRAGYVCRSAFMCCGTCAAYAIAQTPKYKKNKKAVFYHRQDAADFQKTNYVYLGWEGDGEEIVAALRRAGLRAEWNGDDERRILVTGPEPEVERDTLDEENDAEKIARETPPTVEPKAAAEGPVEIGKKPDVDLSNCDGNAFAILGRCSKVARRAGKPQSWVDQFMNEAKSGDYDHLLQTAFRYFEVS